MLPISTVFQLSSLLGASTMSSSLTYLCWFSWYLIFLNAFFIRSEGLPDGCTSGFIERDLLERRASKISSGQQGVSPNSLADDQLLVIPGMNFTCSRPGEVIGLLLGVEIRNMGHNMRILSLEIWRPIKFGRQTRYNFITDILINVDAGDFSSDGVIRYTIPVQDRVAFLNGDVIGVYQEFRSTRHLYYTNNLAVPTGYAQTVSFNKLPDFVEATGPLFNGLILLRPVIDAPDSCLNGFLSENELRQQILQVNINGVVSRPRQQRLFPDIQFTCNGLITKWIVGAETRTSGTRMPELQIWRNNSGDTFTKISSSLLIPNEIGNSNVHEYTPDPPLMFQDGDILGVYQPEDSHSQLVLYYQDNTGPVNYRQSGLVDNPLSSFTYSGTPADEYDYPLVSVEVATKGLPSQLQVASLVTESVITSSIVVLETLRSPLVLTEVNSKVTATKLAIQASPNLMTSSLQFSVTPTSYEGVQLQQSVHSSLTTQIKLLSAPVHGSIRSTKTAPIPSLTPLAPLLADSTQVTVIIGLISGFIMVVVVIIIAVTLIIIFTCGKRSHKNTHSVQNPAVTTSDEIVELQQNESYMITGTNDDMDETNAYEYVSAYENIDSPVVYELNAYVADSRQISLQQNVCYGTTSKANDSETDESKLYVYADIDSRYKSHPLDSNSSPSGAMVEKIA